MAHRDKVDAHLRELRDAEFRHLLGRWDFYDELPLHRIKSVEFPEEGLDFFDRAELGVANTLKAFDRIAEATDRGEEITMETFHE